MPHKLIIDCDPGIGDALAILLALRDPEIDLIGVTAVAGCISGPTASRNIQAIIESIDPAKWPRVGTCDRETIPSGCDLGGAVSSVALNGASGLGDFELRVAEFLSPRESTKLLIDLVRAEPHEITLLTLGPLTNVMMACERAPDFLGLLRGLVCLGGAVSCGGDVTAAAEFNIHLDPEAAQLVLRSRATKTLIPLDVSSLPVFTFEHFRKLQPEGETPLARFLAQTIPFALRAHHERLGQEGVSLHEVVALAAISRQQLFTTQPMAIDVETHGELTRGMTVFDRRRVPHPQPNIDVAVGVDAQGVLDYAMQHLRCSG